jgi:hypothetical protein
MVSYRRILQELPMHARRFLALGFTLAAGLTLSACDDDNPLNPIPTGTLRVANAIADAQPIDAEIEGVPTDINDIAFGTASGERDIPEGNYRVTFTANTGSGSVDFTDDSADVDDEMVTFLYGVGRIAASTQEIFQVQAPDTDLNSGQTEMQFVHVASQQTGPLDIYVTAPGDALLGATPRATLSYKNASSQAILTPGAYRIRITPQGVPTTVLFDSGPTGVSFPGATTQQFALADNTNGAIASTLFLMVLTGDGGHHQIQHVGS